MGSANDYLRLSPNLRQLLSLALGVQLEWHVGDVVRKLREQRRWTQPKLAAASGVNKGTIVNVEEGGNPKIETLTKVAGGLGLTIAQLYALIPTAQGEESQRAEPTATAGRLLRRRTDHE